MSEPTTFASLGPLLLARKGGAKPAIHGANCDDATDDLAQDNGCGEDGESIEAQLAAFQNDEALRAEPEVKRQQQALLTRIADGNIRPTNSAAAQAPAQANGHRAAFTLRLDHERHLKLKLASAVLGASAQQLVTQALDQMLAEMPEIESLAAQITRDGSKA